jgi:hypothetical protein
MSSRLRPVATRQAATITQSLQKLVHVLSSRITTRVSVYVRTSKPPSTFGSESWLTSECVCFGSCLLGA